MCIVKTKNHFLQKKAKRGVILFLVGFVPLITLAFAQTSDGLFFTAMIYAMIIGSIYKQSFIGAKGEKTTIKKLKQLPDEYVLYNDIFLIEKGKQLHFDHLVVGPKGIIIVETNNWHGSLKGEEVSDEWIQKMGSNKHKKVNPCKMLDEQKGLLENIVQVESIYNVLVFPNSLQLKVKSSQTMILKHKQLLSAIENLPTVSFNQAQAIHAIESHILNLNH